MQEFPINYTILTVAALFKFFLGWTWYSPALFMKPWIKLVNMDETKMKAGMGRAISMEFVGSFVLAYVLLHAVHYAGATTISQGATVGFFNWLGFIVVPTMGAVLFEKQSIQLYAIKVGLPFVALIVMGGILTFA